MPCFPKLKKGGPEAHYNCLSSHSGWKLENPFIKKVLSSLLFTEYIQQDTDITKFGVQIPVQWNQKGMNEWSKTNKPNQPVAASKSPLTFKKEKKCCQVYLKQCCFFIIHCFLPSASPPLRFACKWHAFYFFKVHQPLVAYSPLKFCHFTSGCCGNNYVVTDRGLELL